MSTWRDRAACQGRDGLLFFPPKTGGSNTDQALQICGTCVVADECLQHALTAPEQYGVWGGKTEQELRAMRGLRKRPPQCGTYAAYRRHQRHGEKPCGACIEGASRERALHYQEQQASV
jgi:WhiB family transcriptional regulator, redox-sensing transcriptional regulator